MPKFWAGHEPRWPQRSSASANRLDSIIDRQISKNQTTFIKKRDILESVVLAHEFIHDFHSKTL
jgi:hypothetical protein